MLDKIDVRPLNSRNWGYPFKPLMDFCIGQTYTRTPVALLPCGRTGKLVNTKLTRRKILTPNLLFLAGAYFIQMSPKPPNNSTLVVQGVSPPPLRHSPNS